MKAELILRERLQLDENSLIEMRIWQLQQNVTPSKHGLKYSLVYIVDGARIVGYDNERGKGDHRHCGNSEFPYIFTTIEQLLTDFRKDVQAVRGRPI